MPHCFNLRERIFENVSKNIHVNLALVVVFRESARVGGQHIVADYQTIEHLVGLEQTAVVRKNLNILSFVTCV